MKRTAAEWGKAGSEDHPRIGQIAISDDAPADLFLCFADKRFDKPVGKIGGWRGCGAFLYLPVCPGIKALSRFFAQLVEFQVGMQAGGQDGIGRKLFAGSADDVKANGVSQLKGTHG